MDRLSRSLCRIAKAILITVDRDQLNNGRSNSCLLCGYEWTMDIPEGLSVSP